jgi:TM2 domain-containing membrane protein YozV
MKVNLVSKLAKRLWLTILLAVVISGLGHIYLGYVKRGIIILIIGVILTFAMPLFIPIPWSWIITLGYWLWQIWDAYKHYKKLNVGQTQVTK